MTPALKPYPAYKDSGVTWLGDVPEHWQVVPARAVYKPKLIKNTGMIESTVLSLSYGRIIVKPAEKLHGLVPESFETYQIIDPGNIIVRATDLQNDQTSLRVGYSNYRGIITSAYMCLETTDRLSSDFGYQLLNTYDLLKIIYGYGSGLRQNLDFGEIKRMPVLVPPKRDQASIVRFLRHSEKGIRRYVLAKQRLIKLLEEQKQSIIHSAVTRGFNSDEGLKPCAMETLDVIPSSWRVRPLIRSCIERADYRGATPPKTESGVFLVTAKNIKPGWIDYETSKEYVDPDDYNQIMRRGRPRIGDLLFTTEAPLGNFALVDREDVALAQRVIRFRLDKRVVLPLFALYSVLSPYFQNQLLRRATGSTALGIKASKLPQLLLALPPIEDQQGIIDWIASKTAPLQASIEHIREELSLLLEYRTRLIADVVTGKLDVHETAAGLPDEDVDSDESSLVETLEGADDPDTGQEEMAEEEVIA